MGALSRYIEAAALRAFVLVAASLTGLFSLLEFVEQLASVGQGHYRLRDALAYVALTAPSRLLQVAAVSMLLASLIALGALARTSELVAMLGLGLSERRIVGVVLRLTIPIVAVLLLLSEFVIPPAQQRAQSLRADALATQASRAEDSVWAEGEAEAADGRHGGQQYLSVQQVERGAVPVGIDIYSFGPDGSLDSLVHAERAAIRPDGTWDLAEVSRRTVADSQFRTEHLASLPWRSFIPAGQLELLTLAPDSLPPVALVRQIRALRREHRPAARYERELWAKASIPLSMVAMVLIAAPMVFGAPRTRGSQRLARGVGLAIVFSLCQQILERLGQLLDLSPAATALAPALLVLAAAIALFPRSGGRARRAAAPQG